jgi:hypothetical protein
MSDFSNSEIMAEVAKIFRAGLNPGHDGGTLNTATEYRQLMEMASITFLMNNDAIFYAAMLARNRLNALTVQEIAYVEDILVALEDLAQIGRPTVDIATLNNASTTLLTLDSSNSVAGRPELARFTNLMTQFAGGLYSNVVSQSTGALVRPREEAREVIRQDLAALKELHAQVLTGASSLRDVLDNYVAMDIPSKVSAASFANIRNNLDSMVTTLENASSEQNIAKSRSMLLTTLASKVAITTIAEFSDPREVKYRSPTNPIPSTAKHLGQVIGSGTPASISSSPGPWNTPIENPLVVRIGSVTYSIPMSTFPGSGVNGNNAAPLIVPSTTPNLHVLVDEAVWQDVLDATSSVNIAVVNNFMPLTYKHVGTCVTFPDAHVPSAPFSQDIQPKIITDLRPLQTFNITAYDPSTHVVSLGSASASDEPALGLQAAHVGAYLKQGSVRWEILEVLTGAPGASSALLSMPVGVATPTVAACTLFGMTTLVSGTQKTKFYFDPPLVNGAPSAGNRIIIGPTTKTASIPTGSGVTLSQILTSIQVQAGDYSVFGAGDKVGQPLHLHVLARAMTNDSSRLSLVARSMVDPLVKISGRFLKVVPDDALQVVTGSAHPSLGFLEGQTGVTSIIEPWELAEWINVIITGASAAAVTTELGGGTTMFIQSGTANLVDASVVDFSKTVQIGDQIEVFGSPAVQGVYQVTSVSGSTLTTSSVIFPSSEKNLTYRLFRQQVTITSDNKGPGSVVEIVSSPPELGFPVGVNHGVLHDFQAVDQDGSLLRFDGVVAGDLLRLSGSSIEHPIGVVNGSTLTLSDGLPSNTTGIGFEIQSAAAVAYQALHEEMSTFITSVLPRNQFDKNLNAIDAALTAAVLPGQNFTSSRNKARQMVAELLAVLTSSPRRSSEYTVTIPVSPLTLEDLLATYSVAKIPVLDALLNTFLDRKYNRAVQLLQSGQIKEFYATNDETGSFGGAVINTSRTVVQDLPVNASNAWSVDNQQNLATSFREVPDADEDFRDTDGQTTTSE